MIKEQEDSSPHMAPAGEIPGVPEPGAGAPAPSFEELGVTPDVRQALSDMGFTAAMPVQVSCLPLARAGRDLIVQSRTGSGKTAAFGIPLVDWLVNPEDKFVQAIVLLPTRELALQVAAEMARIAAHSNVSVVPVYGGAPMGRQIEQLRAGGQIVCGTPGRVLDHMRRGTLKLDRVKCAVLDECDEMLSMGFQEDIEAILDRTPPERQTLLFSATVPEGIQRLSRRFMREPEKVKLSADFIGVHEIRHIYYSIPGGQRESELQRVIAFEDPERAIVFCNTREETGRVAEYLRRQDFDAEAISSDLSQSDRERVMTRMRAGSIRFLVATDVAARGIDLENLPCVINYTFPESPEIYIHRTGRTGRAGKNGTAISLIGPTEVGSFYYIKLLYKIKPEERSLPSEAEIRSKREGERVLQLRAKFSTEPSAEWRSLARRVMGAVDGESLVAALLADTFGKDHAPPKVAAARTERSEPARPAEAKEATRFEQPMRMDDHRDRRPRGRADGRGERERRPSRDDRAERRSEPGPAAVARSPREGVPAASFAPPPERKPTAGGSKEEAREFWEVWSEEVGRTSSGGEGTSSRPERAPRPSSASEPERVRVSAGQSRLYLNLGRKDGASADEIAALLSAEGADVATADIELMNTHTYINVASERAEQVCAALSGKERQGRQLLCEPARPPKRR